MQNLGQQLLHGAVTRIMSEHFVIALVKHEACKPIEHIRPRNMLGLHTHEPAAHLPTERHSAWIVVR